MKIERQACIPVSADDPAVLFAETIVEKLH
jgi:hypothetical protein